MFNKDTINYECIIHPRHLNDKLDTIILKQAKDALENKCSGYGFIKQIIKIQQKTDGKITNDGFILFNIFLEVLICSPNIGDIIECEITDKDERIGKPMMKKEPLLVVIFSNKEYNIGDKINGIITDKRINKTNNMINLLVDAI